MSRRPPNELETKLHQAALSAPKRELTAKQAESIITDANVLQDTLNFLLAVGLFKSLVGPKGALSFRAVTKDELTATKGLSGEENLVLGHIKSSANEGIWTKHLKAKTNLHQTIIDRCLKTLIQKRLIKRVPSVQHLTRKIYMLEGIEPSIALTGGPWYTDNELDTEFIEHLRGACLKFIRDVSFPKRRGGAEGVLYGISNSPEYPTAPHIRNSLRKARLTETDLSVEHVEMLLNVLILDGEIEKIPAFGTSLWDSNAFDDDDQDETEHSSKRKRKRRLLSDGDDDSNKRKRGKKPVSDEDSDSDDTSKKSKRKRRKSAADSGDDSEHAWTRKRKKRKGRRSDSEEECDDEEAVDNKSRRRKLKRALASSDEEDESSSEDSDHNRRGKRSKATKRSPSPFQPVGDSYSGGGFVYRAIKPERISLGWSESPCSKCPSFDFCKNGGPVNPQECVYYGDWLASGTASTE